MRAARSTAPPKQIYMKLGKGARFVGFHVPSECSEPVVGACAEAQFVWSSTISISDAFQSFVNNLALDNDGQISTRYGEITRALNLKFRSTDSRSSNNLQVGSYGRVTAIKGISDLDMLYIMPAGKWVTYNVVGGQYRILRDTADAISERYPTTDVRVDGLVVRVLYSNFHVEVQPVFKQDDGSFLYPHTRNGGSWKRTKPQEEIDAIRKGDADKNNNLRRLCKMIRAWKNKHGVAMGGLLIDTLVHKFLHQTNNYDDKSYSYYDWMVRDFFAYIKDLPKQDYFAALGSGQRVKVKKNFQAKAKRAHDLVLEAIAAEKNDNRNEKWRLVFGRGFPPAPSAVKKAVLTEGMFEARNTEQFIEDQYPVDIRYNLSLECEVTQHGFQTRLLRAMQKTLLPLRTKKSLRFFVSGTDIPNDDFKLYWKVLNRGPEAIKRNLIRGQIFKDSGKLEQVEKTNFEGDHIVEAYAVQNGTVIAKDRIHVTISPGVDV